MPSADPSRRAVVTGVGAVTPIGNDAATYWSNLLAGVSGAGPITSFDASRFDVRIAAEVKGFDATRFMDRKMARRMTRFIHFGVAAAEEAIAASGLDFAGWTPEQRDRAAVVLNTGGGGMEAVTEGHDTLREKGPGQVSPFAVPALSGSMAGAQITMRHGLTGPLMTQVAACASGVIAFQDALRLIQTGECDVVIAGGSEAPLLPIAFAALSNMGALSKRNDDPTHASPAARRSWPRSSALPSQRMRTTSARRSRRDGARRWPCSGPWTTPRWVLATSITSSRTGRPRRSTT